MTIGVATGVLAASPWDFFDLHTAIFAIDPPHPIANKEGYVPDWYELKEPYRLCIVDTAFAQTGRADGFGASPWFEMSYDCGLVLVEADILINEALELVDFVE